MSNAEKTQEQPRPLPFYVHYYDPKRRGTWVQRFANRADAEAFAVGKTVWGNPCKVEEAR